MSLNTGSGISTRMPPRLSMIFRVRVEKRGCTEIDASGKKAELAIGPLTGQFPLPLFQRKSGDPSAGNAANESKYSFACRRLVASIRRALMSCSQMRARAHMVYGYGFSGVASNIQRAYSGCHWEGFASISS